MISKEEALKAIKLLNNSEEKKKFTQTIDVAINLKDLNLKNPEDKVDFFDDLPHPVRNAKVCAIVGPELLDQARENADLVITADDIDNYKDKPREIKKLTNEYDFFVAQANLMPKMAMVFGKILGTRGKMPNPKAGCVLPPKGSLAGLKERFSKKIRIQAKNDLVAHTLIGRESDDERSLAENLHALIDHLVHHLPKGHNNLKSVYIKKTMGKPVKVI